MQFGFRYSIRGGDILSVAVAVSNQRAVATMTF